MTIEKAINAFKRATSTPLESSPGSYFEVLKPATTAAHPGVKLLLATFNAIVGRQTQEQHFGVVAYLPSERSSQRSNHFMSPTSLEG